MLTPEPHPGDTWPWRDRHPIETGFVQWDQWDIEQGHISRPKFHVIEHTSLVFLQVFPQSWVIVLFDRGLQVTMKISWNGGYSEQSLYRFPVAILQTLNPSLSKSKEHGLTLSSGLFYFDLLQKVINFVGQVVQTCMICLAKGHKPEELITHCRWIQPWYWPLPRSSVHLWRSWQIIPGNARHLNLVAKSESSVPRDSAVLFLCKTWRQMYIDRKWRL